MVLWWQAAGTIPSAEEALARLERLTTLGPTAEAFTFKQRFAAPDTAGEKPAAWARPGLRLASTGWEVAPRPA